MKPYREAVLSLVNKTIDWDSDSVVVTLHTSTYTPNLDTHQFQSSLTNELTTGGGYTAGGLAVAGRSQTYTAANSWTVQRANSTAYAVDDVVRPATGNGFLYRCAVAGTSGGSIPTYSTVLGRETTDGTVTWETVGSGIVVLNATDPNWTGATFGPCRYAVFADTTPGSAATNPLIGLVDFGVDKTGGGANFTVTLHTALRALHFFIP
jgi:hypothetical protein